MLITVLVAIVVLALVVGSLAQRVDSLRQQSAALDRLAVDRAAEHSALATALYWVGTRAPAAAGWGRSADAMVIADGRDYDVDGRAVVNLRDQRGYVSLNIVDRRFVAPLLAGLGVAPGKLDAMVDILEDYVDSDNLKRLNGAESAEYQQAGLPPPRNDWLVSPRELKNMPVWREEILREPKIETYFSARRSGGLNPNTAPLPLLAAVLPGVAPEALREFDLLRREKPFENGEIAQRSTGLPLARDDFSMFVGNQLWITVRAPGASRGHAYNVLLTPSRRQSPWVITEHHAAARNTASHEPSTPTPFPFAASAPVGPGAAASSSR